MSLIKNKTTSFTSPSKIAFKLASSIVSTSSLHPSSPSRIRSSTYGNDSSSNNGSNSGGVNADHDDELKLVSVFLETAEKRVAEEYDRAVRFFDISSVEKVYRERD